MRMKASRSTLIAAAVAAVVTLLVVLLPTIRLAYRNPTLHVALDTADGLIALLVAYLIFGRYSQRPLGRYLALAYALVLLGVASLFFSAVPAVVAGDREGVFSTWAPIAIRMVATTAFAFAAFAPARASRAGGRALQRVAIAAIATLVVVGATVLALVELLPPGVESSIAPTATRPRLEDHPAVLATQVATFLLLAIATVGFTRLAERDDDELMRWFAAGSAVGALARVNYMLFPSLYSDYVYVGDFLRLGFYLLLLTGAAREIMSYWRSLADAAVLEERRRMARDLHDGLAQELSFIWRAVRGASTVARGDEIAAAAERALDESRRAIAALTRPVDEPLDVSLAQAAEEVADRVGARVRFDLQPGVEVAADAREHLLRIVREAITNAVRHGSARSLMVTLAVDDRVRLRIRDDGTGFDVAADPLQNRGFGLVSMRERAQELGGELRLSSQPGAGTEIEVVLPSTNE